MKIYKNLIIIGTSHIAIQSIKEVENIILNEKPDVVALELDKPRFLALMKNKKEKLKFRDIKYIGIKGYLFNLIGAWIEKRIGETVGVLPGSEMKKAVKSAIKVKADISLIDQNIKITLKKLSKKLTWKEKFRFIYDVLKGLILRKPKIQFDLTKVPDEKTIKKLTNQVKKNYPTVYNVLIKERNEIMAKRLYTLMNNKRSIVAIVGAGHEPDIISIIHKCYQKSNLQKKK